MRHLPFALLLLLTACSPFNRTWNNHQQPPNAHPLVGRWQGTWQSNHNQHTGDLRAIITETGDDQFSAWYHATYAGFLKFTYTIPFTADQQGDHYHITGSADLGPLKGGHYQYTAHTDGRTLHADYTADVDHGTYHLKKIP